MIEYNGKSYVLMGLAEYNVSQEVFDIVEKYGPSDFLKLAKQKKLYSTAWKQFRRWLKKAPCGVRKELYEKFRSPLPDDNDEWIAINSLNITLEEMERYIKQNPAWFDEASLLLQLLLEKIFFEDKAPCAEEEKAFFLVEEAFRDYIDEAMAFLGYAGFLH